MEVTVPTLKSPDVDMLRHGQPMTGDDIRAARKARGWSVPRLIYALNEAAWRDGLRLMTNASLKTSISRWENNRVRPDEFHSRLLAMVLALPARNAKLGGERTWHDDGDVGFNTSVVGSRRQGVNRCQLPTRRGLR